MVVVAVITAALIIILSVFNGLEDLLRTINNSFDPQIKIEASKGKTFEVDEALLGKLKGVQGVEYVTEVIQDYAYVRYRNENNNQVITLKGVSDNFIEQNRIPRESLVDGELKLREGNVPYALLGSGVQYSLSVATGDAMYPLQLYYIKNTKASLDPSRMYSRKNIIPGGVFSIVQDFNENYVVVPLDFAQELLEFGNKRTAIEVKTAAGADVFQVENKLQDVLGESFNVLNYEEQHKDIYRLLKMEKLFSFFAFTLLLGIGAINIFFSLMMLALDKKKDIAILGAMGAPQETIRRIFLYEGGLIAAAGAGSGILLGVIFCLLQQRFALVSMGIENAVTQGYPVKLDFPDVASTAVAVAVITFLISIRPAVLASRFGSVRHL